MQLKTHIPFKKIGLAIALVIAFFLFYETWCPIERILGFPCPGCNMLSAIYHLFRLDLCTALYFHPLVIVFVFYAFMELVFYLKYKSLHTKQARNLRIVFFVLLFLVYVYRMVTIFPNYPMQFNENAYLVKLFSLFQ